MEKAASAQCCSGKSHHALTSQRRRIVGLRWNSMRHDTGDIHAVHGTMDPREVRARVHSDAHTVRTVLTVGWGVLKRHASAGTHMYDSFATKQAAAPSKCEPVARCSAFTTLWKMIQLKVHSLHSDKAPHNAPGTKVHLHLRGTALRLTPSHMYAMIVNLLCLTLTNQPNYPYEASLLRTVAGHHKCGH